jgi:hypothetical protein
MRILAAVGRGSQRVELSSCERTRRAAAGFEQEGPIGGVLSCLAPGRASSILEDLNGRSRIRTCEGFLQWVYSPPHLAALASAQVGGSLYRVGRALSNRSASISGQPPVCPPCELNRLRFCDENRSIESLVTGLKSRVYVACLRYHRLAMALPRPSSPVRIARPGLGICERGDR